jgi:protein-L-isoaspartate(D-aspartate) O-methyltransferase
MNDPTTASDIQRAKERLGLLGHWYASRPRGTPPHEIEGLLAADADLERTARTARAGLVADVVGRAGPFDPPMLTALVEVPRERFVRPDDIGDSTVDTPLFLDDGGLATVSAPHAYLLSFRVLGLKSGDRLAELGAGSGYGAALASRIVGQTGGVLTIEIDRPLADRAARLLASYANVRVLEGDAGAVVDHWRGFDRISVAFAVASVPAAWVEALPAGGRMVIPVGRDECQRLVRIERQSDGGVHWSDHGAVRYVPDRGSAARAAPAAAPR